MTTSPPRTASVLAASVGAFALLAASASAQQSPTRYGDFSSQQDYLRSLQSQGPSYHPYGQPAGQGTPHSQYGGVGDAPGFDRPPDPFAYGSAGPSYRGEPYEAGPPGPAQQHGPHAQQPAPRYGQQAFGLGYLHGRVDARQIAEERIRRIGEELFELGFRHGLETGLSNSGMRGEMIQRYGRDQFDRGYQAGRTDTLASAQTGAAEPGRTGRTTPRGGADGEYGAWFERQQAQIEDEFAAFERDQRQRHGAGFSQRPGFEQDFEAWRAEQSQRLDSAFAQWRAHQPPAESVPGASARAEADPQGSAASAEAQSPAQRADDVSAHALGSPEGGEATPGAFDRTAAAKQDSAQETGGADLAVEPENAAALVGRTVQSSDHEPVGRVEAVILSPNGDDIEVLVVERTDGFLMGVPSGAVRSATAEMVALGMTAQEIRSNRDEFRFESSMNAVRGEQR